MATYSSLDTKQHKIIEAWLERSKTLSSEQYFAFISLWISFNAFCCSCYAGKANKRRPDIRKGKGLQSATEIAAPIEGTIQLESERIVIDLQKPGKITIAISERYTEDLIFDQFVQEFRDKYQLWLRDTGFRESVLAFQSSLAKGSRYFVINMAKVSEFDKAAKDAKDQREFPNDLYRSLVSKNVLIPFDNPNDLGQLKDALYQVRCNVFHGEKAPGDPNDDRIVGQPFPVLEWMMNIIVQGMANARNAF